MIPVFMLAKLTDCSFVFSTQSGIKLRAQEKHHNSFSLNVKLFLLNAKLFDFILTDDPEELVAD